MAINDLLIKVTSIKSNDEELKGLIDAYNTNLELLRDYEWQLSIEPEYISVYTGNDKKGVACYEDEYNERHGQLVKMVNEQRRVVADLLGKIHEKKVFLSNLCESANVVIANILTLNGILSSSEINSMLPKYEIYNNNLDNLDWWSMPINPAIDIDSSDTEGYFIEGDELAAFRKDNNIPSENTDIYRLDVLVNNVLFPIYYFYDTTCDEKQNEVFRKYANDSLAYASLIDEKVLQYIKAGGTSLVFEQTINCDSGSKQLGYFNGQHIVIHSIETWFYFFIQRNGLMIIIQAL